MWFTNIKNEIKLALMKHAAFEAERIQVETRGPKVILRGIVGTWEEWDQINQAVWSIPGIMEVENQIAVHWS